MENETKLQPWSAAERAAELARYEDFSAAHKADLDEIAQAAAAIAGAPIALLTFLTEDHQFFKAAVGTQLTGTPRAISFCTHAIESQETMIVPDMLEDARFIDHPLVTGPTQIRFYAGVPLRTPEGMPLGTLCVLDQAPKVLAPAQTEDLAKLADRVLALLAGRKQQLAGSAL